VWAIFTSVNVISSERDMESRKSAKASVSVIVPARNEGSTIARVVEVLATASEVGEILVIDNGSRDDTAKAAAAAGARVLKCEREGLGYAMKMGLREASYPFALRTDGDIDNWDRAWLDQLLPPRRRSLTRAIFVSPHNRFPVTNLVVRPFFQLYRPHWDAVPLPTTGTYMFDRECFPVEELPDDWAIDIAILVRALASTDIAVSNVNIGTLSDKRRPIEHYVPMARDINSYLTRYFFEDSRAALDLRNDEQ
jgi:glucosyl-3-phosphoglycerate synthase